MVFVVRVGHSFKVKSHQGSTLKVSKFEEAGCRVSINIEEFGERGSALGEIRVFSSLVPLLVVIDDVSSFRSEKREDFLVFEKCVVEPYFINSWLLALVPDSGGCE